MRLRIIRGGSGEWVGQFRVSVYQCTIIIPASGSSYEVMWRPHVPTKMSGLMTAQFQVGRDTLFGRFKSETGRTVVAFDEPPNAA